MCMLSPVLQGRDLRDFVQSSMLEYVVSGNSELRERVAESCQPLVHWVLKNEFRFIPKEHKEDAFAEGNVGLTRAIDGYDGRAAFSTYAVVCIYRSVLDYLKKESLYRPVSLNKQVFENVEFQDVLPSFDNETYQSDYEGLARAVDSVLRAYLSDVEREIVRLKYGIGCEPHSFQDMESKFNLSRARLHQIERKSIRKLRIFGLEDLFPLVD